MDNFMTEILGTAVRLKTATGVIDISTIAPPMAGQVLRATSATTAVWANPPTAFIPGTGTGTGGGAWTRPAEWLPLAEITEGFSGLFEVIPANSVCCFPLIPCDCTIDWGDGNTETFASGTYAIHNYTFASISNAALSSGNKQVVVTMTPTVAGGFIDLDLGKYLDAASPAFYVARKSRVRWLDIRFGGPGFTCQSASQLGASFIALSSIELINTAPSLTKMPNMFRGGLIKYAKVNAPYVTDMSQAFYVAGFLEKIDIVALGVVTNMSQCFYRCNLLPELPLIDTSAVTNFYGAFQYCVTIKTIPESYTTAAATDVGSIVSDCYNLEAVPVWNLNSLAYSAYGVGEYGLDKITSFVVLNLKRSISISDFNWNKAQVEWFITNCLIASTFSPKLTTNGKFVAPTVMKRAVTVSGSQDITVSDSTGLAVGMKIVGAYASSFSASLQASGNNRFVNPTSSTITILGYGTRLLPIASSNPFASNSGMQLFKITSKSSNDGSGGFYTQDYYPVATAGTVVEFALDIINTSVSGIITAINGNTVTLDTTQTVSGVFGVGFKSQDTTAYIDESLATAKGWTVV
jgi:hypothetical protein